MPETEAVNSQAVATREVRAPLRSNISFVADPAAIADALSVARLVAPRGGFLFAVRRDRCTVVSHDGVREARSTFAITEGVGEGEFVYPAEFADEFAHLNGGIRFESKRDGEAFSVGYAFGSGGSVTHASIDPRTIPSAGHREAALGSEINVGVLAAALRAAKPFVAAADDTIADDHCKAVHVFRDGTLYASNGMLACYFRSEALVGRELEVLAPQLPLLEKFVKRSSGVLRVQRTSKRVSVVNDRDDVIGWLRNAGALAKYASLKKNDDVVALVNVAAAQATIRHVQSALGKHARKVRLHIDPARGCWLTSATATSILIPAEFMEFRPPTVLVGNVNVDHFAKLFGETTGDVVEFRVALVPPSGNRVEPAFFYRTIDSFVITEDGATRVGDATASSATNAHRCSVTRYAPGIDR